jgi:hypothetical protein
LILAPSDNQTDKMGLRDMLKKKDKLSDEYSPDHAATVSRLANPEFTFIRSDTHTQEVIYPPAGPPASLDEKDGYLTAKDSSGSKPRRSLDVFKGRSRGSSVSSVKSESSKKEGTNRRLSHRLHLSRNPGTSEYVPQDLPQIRLPTDDVSTDKEAAEREWENRATMLAQQNETARSRSATPSPAVEKGNPYDVNALTNSLPQKGQTSSSSKVDEDLQEAIRLHETGSLEQSTLMFGLLADPNGANNPLSQVLYGLALRSVCHVNSMRVDGL